ncbi:hypothetical protein [Streptomyces griseorubiginosus]|uniref:hypothetical protein n=1 Tax=Streptomyces griseorubiginosus TaxID=67304 RepID=UPI0027E277AB|nr:hypothetical protein [Streptomyces griseorubiginosus]
MPVPVLLKLEFLQHTGSFKIRGASNALAVLSAAEDGAPSPASAARREATTGRPWPGQRAKQACPPPVRARLLAQGKGRRHPIFGRTQTYMPSRNQRRTS